MKLDPDKATAKVMEICGDIHEILGGVHPAMQGCILAELLSTWLAGHMCEDDVEQTKLRKEVLDEHLAMVWKLVPIQDVKVRAILQQIKEQADAEGDSNGRQDAQRGDAHHH